MKHLLFGIVLLTLAGCKGPKDFPAAPSGIIARDSMIQILSDIHVADAVSDHKFGDDKSDIDFTNAMYGRVFQNHHITAATFRASFKYYQEHPDQMDKMYEQIIAEISKRAADLKKGSNTSTCP